MNKADFEDFLTQRSDEIDNAAFLLAATLTTPKSVFVVPNFVGGADASWNTVYAKIAEHQNGLWVVSEDALKNAIDAATAVLHEHGIEVTAGPEDTYVLMAAYEMFDALVSAGTDVAVETVFSYDIDDAKIEWDMSFIADIVDAAAKAVEDSGLLPCIPYFEGKNETPCHCCKVSDCQRRVHLLCPLLPEKQSGPGAEMETLAQRDAELKRLWESLTDVPFDETEEGRLILAEPWETFPAGTDREDIWHWFDVRYSKGVANLLYDEGRLFYTNVKEKAEELATLAFRKALCFECMSEHCAFNPEGICSFPLVYGRKPEMTEDDGCLDSLLARNALD